MTSAVAANGAIELDSLSEQTRTALGAAGMTEQRLARVAGKDARIDSLDEAVQLFNSVERFVAEPQRGPLLQALLAEFQLHAQRALTLEDALVLPLDLAHGFESRRLDVPGVDQFSLADDPKKGNGMCFMAAARQLERYFTDQGKRPLSLADSSQRIQVAIHETTSGRIEVDPAAALRARAYIDDCLDAGRPVLVGVSAVSLASGRVNEGITEHFVTIRGRGLDERGRLYYEFKDPGDGGRSGRFYVAPDTGKLFKPGKTLAELGGAGYARDMLYEVSQVRTYRDPPTP